MASRVFCDEIRKDELAKKRAEVAVITFGGMARIEIPFTEGRDLQPRRFGAQGGTPMGAAIDLALDELHRRKEAYKSSGLEYYRPWLFLLTDGEPPVEVAVPDPRGQRAGRDDAVDKWHKMGDDGNPLSPIVASPSEMLL